MGRARGLPGIPLKGPALRRWLTVLSVAVLAAAVWTVASPLPWPVRLFTTFLVGVLPPLLLPQIRMAREEDFGMQRQAAYLSSMLTLWGLAGIGLAAALASGFTPRLLGLTAPPAGSLLLWTAGTLAALFLVLVLGRLLRIPETPLLRELLPRDAGDRRLFVLLSLSAGVSEELVFRGVLIGALTVALGSTGAAAVVSSAVFGFLHTYQGGPGTLRAAVLGVVLAMSFIGSGSLLPPIIAHAALNVLAGIWLSDWLLRR